VASLRRTRQILKSLADDTRLRIINLLANGEINVAEICETLGKKQPLVSKHLTRLRLLDVVNDRRDGANVYYSLRRQSDPVYQGIVKAVTKGFSDIEVLQKDQKRMEQVKEVDVN
jgi:ArsR family transcriptional regulator, arsenate/arsenite/antimonite-responsive transcriptional repressor